MVKITKKLVKKTFNLIGLDVVRISKNPRWSLLGLRKLPIRTIVDVGANTGQFARYISDLLPEANILSFEPLAGPFKELQRWGQNKQDGRVTAFNLALGEEEGEVEIFGHEDHSPSSSFLKTTDVCETLYPFTKKQVARKVQLTTLDKIIGSLSRPLVPDILIKLDVQGYEDRVIRGGKKHLTWQKFVFWKLIWISYMINKQHLMRLHSSFMNLDTIMLEI